MVSPAPLSTMRIHQNLLGVVHAAHFAAYQVVAAVVDATRRMILVVEEDNLFFCGDLPIGVQHNDGCINVHIGFLLK